MCRFYAWALVLFLMIGSGRTQAKSDIRNGSAVSFHYVLTIDGKVTDQSKAGAPMKYIQGSGQIIPGLEEALKSARVGEKKRVVVPPAKGYGEIHPDMYQSVPKKSIKKGSKLKSGTVVTGQYEGRPVRATIVGQDEKNYFLDLNHPMAGKTLQFDVEVIDIQPPAMGR